MSGKYSKFDSFLKRKLSNKEYKEVKIYEPCVVTSCREKHAFRFTFVTRDKIYITENPPKSLLYWAHLKYVVDIYVVNDKAAFLQSDLRESAQHVVVKYVGNGEGNLKIPKSSSTDIQYDPNTRSSRSYSIATFQRFFSGRSSFSAPKDHTSSKSGIGSSLWSHNSTNTLDENFSDTASSINGGESETKRWSLFEKVKDKNPKASDVIRWMQEDPYPVQVLQPKDGLLSALPLEELHLYILNENTTFLLMLKCAWKNWIICHSFAQQGNGHTERQSTLSSEDVTSSPEMTSSRDDTTTTLFAGLKEELQRMQDVENLYGLFNELQAGSTQNVHIKTLFWRDDALFKRSMDLANRYVRESVLKDISERADEIELAVMVLQTVAVMLRETEAIPQCYKVLQNLSQPYLKKIIEVLISPVKMSSPTWGRDSNISSLASEVTAASGEVLYELINATQQINWVLVGKSPVFNATVLFNAINQSNQMIGFLDRIMATCKRSWDSSAKDLSRSSGTLGVPDALEPEDAVQVYRLFTVLHRIIAKSNSATQYAKDNFKEEFKYYIHPRSVAKKFPPEYAISGMGRAVVHAIGLCVSGTTL